ncbi:MAG: POTRA domain-containing protein [Vicinamibacterales bacterium]
MRLAAGCLAACVVLMATGAPLRARQAAQDSTGQTVVRVRFEVEGRPDLSPDLTAMSDVRAGEPLRPEAVRATIAHLDALGRYDNVIPVAVNTPAGLEIVFRLVPRHPITRLVVSGQTGIPAKTLQDRIQQRYDGVPTRAKPDQVAVVAQELLSDDGYLESRVTASTQLIHDPDSAVLTLDVAAGPLVLVHESQVTLRGANLVSAAEVTRRSQTQAGQPYRRRAIDAALVALEDDLRTRGFYEAQATVQPARTPAGMDLAITVDTGPRVQLIVKPESALVGGGVDDLIPIKRLGSADLDLLEDSRARIETRLKSDGYLKGAAPFTRVLQDDAQLLTITFTVTRGARYYVDRIDLPAALTLSETNLREMLQVREGEVFNEARYLAGLSRIVDEYRRRGYYTVSIETEPTYEEVPARQTPSRAYVVLRPKITEGPRAVVGRIDFAYAGEHLVSEADLRQVLQSRAGQPYVERQAALDQAALRTLYRNRGFRSAEVSLEPQPAADRQSVSFTIRINEGPQAVIGEVVIVGNQHVSTDSIREDLRLVKGQPAGDSALSEARRRLEERGVFRRVGIQWDEVAGEEHEIHVVVNVQEAPDTTTSVGGGLEAARSTRVTTTGNEDFLELSPRGFFEIGRRNLGGRNRALDLFSRVSLKPRQAPTDPVHDGRGFGFTEYRVSGTYRERRAFRSATDIIIGITSEQAKRTSFNFVRNGANAEFLRRMSAEVNLSGRYILEFTRLLEERFSDDERPLIDRLFPQVRLSILATGLSWDRRSNPLNPDSGTFVTADFEAASRAIGSEVSYVKSFFQASEFRALDASKRTVLAVRGELGAARSFLGAESGDGASASGAGACGQSQQQGQCPNLPASQRFFAGGGTTVRGFQLDRLGIPEILTEDGLSLGGDALIVANVELRRALTTLLGRKLTGVGFVDAGNVFARASQLSLGRLRGAAGFGFRYDSPLGPIRLDLGFKLAPQSINGKPDGRRERGWEYHLSIGEAF